MLFVRSIRTRLSVAWPHLSVVAAVAAGACGGGSSNNPLMGTGDGSLGDAGDRGPPPAFHIDGSLPKVDGSNSPPPIDITSVTIGVGGTDAGAGDESGTDAAATPTPVLVTIADDGTVSTTPSTLQFTANSGSRAVNVGWSVDRGEIGTISSSGVFTPTGKVGGTVKIIAGFGTPPKTTSVTVSVILKRTQNGFKGPIDLTGAGGYGGVGGEGPGRAVSASDLAAFQMPPVADPARTWLYPYDKTVWPRGLLAPLLMWTPGAKDATAMALHLESKTYVYDGYFARPAALKAADKFVRHPIPQDVWKQATDSTAGDDVLHVSLVFLAGGVASGPITRNWLVAPAILQGTVYYNSYGTLLVQNSDFLAQDGTSVGAAVLAIKPGDTAPHVVAGTNNPKMTNGSFDQSGVGCRACHTVAAGGSRLIVQREVFPYPDTSLYDLKTLAESKVAQSATFGWAGLSPDGTYALTNGPAIATTDADTRLFQFNAAGVATQLSVTGLPAGIRGATPTFSPDAKHVAFTLVSGTLGTLTGDGKQVVTLEFDASGPAMNNPKPVFAIPPGPDACVGFPSFLPTNDAILVQLQLAGCKQATFGPYIGTGSVKSELWWTDVATGIAKQQKLHALNGENPDGTPYLPVGANGHTDDTKLNYEPTVNPAPSGGYAWAIFTSRRLYGNVATIDPFSSDPRNYDYAHQITTKKLWVAAINLNAPPGTDPSHPAFYLPAQELQAGNARGYWVLDPCLDDGKDCQSGDQCCGGYCQPVGAGGALVCANKTLTCAQYGDKCKQASDCCDSAAKCINGICSSPTPITLFR